ncbi:hypothetical protein OPIT5_00320 (plasmid) [Opitutaceae bacterium TAV5]|nr:hypothetical protein OPIT5_00320 [Opitutaceae bacterium TAV5]
MHQDELDFEQVSIATTTPTVIVEDDAENPLAAVPDGIDLTPAEKAALGRLMEYTRKGTMKPRMVTRQQWIEDLLSRGFTELQTMKWGRAPARLRIIAPNRLNRRKQPQFYEVQSAIEISYVRRRHAEIFGSSKRPEAFAEGPSVESSQRQRPPTAIKPPPLQRQPVQRPTEPDPTGGRVPGERNVTGRPKVPRPAVSRDTGRPESGGAGGAMTESHLISDTEGGDRKPAEAFASAWAEDIVDIVTPPAGSQREIAMEEAESDLARRILGRFSGRVSPDEYSTVTRIAPFFARRWSQLVRMQRVGVIMAVLERVEVNGLSPAIGLAIAEEGWHYFEKHALNRGESLQSVLPEGRMLRDTLRKWVNEDAWISFLRERVSRNSEKVIQEEAPGAVLSQEERDFHYEEHETVTPAGKKTRIRANIEAIRTMKKLEAEDRLATDAEKSILAKFNGWGGTKELFQNNDAIVETFQRGYGYGGGDFMAEVRAKAERDKELWGAETGRYSPELSYLNWEAEYGDLQKELRELMTEAEWNAASASILNSHYTEESVCHWLWKIARKAGFAGGRVIEPAAGSGRILGAMPPDLRARSAVEAVEVDSVAARITAKLFPQAKVHACGFEEAMIPMGSADLVIANVPFSEIGPGVQEGLGPVPFNLHNYFIAEAMRKLKPSGIAVIITSASTLQNNDDQRAELAKVAELWGSVRLPGDAFVHNAGTEVVTDVLLLRKPDGQYYPEAENWTQLMPVELPDEGKFTGIQHGEEFEVGVASVNEYYIRHPEMVLGYHSLRGKMYGKDKQRGQYTVTSPEGAPPLVDRLSVVTEKIPHVPNSSERIGGKISVVSDPASLMATMDERPGSLVVRGHDVYVVRSDRELVAPEWKLSGDLPAGFRKLESAEKMARDYVNIRELLMEQIAMDLNILTTDEVSAAHRGTLNRAYESFVKDHGRLNDVFRKLRGLAPQDTTLTSVFALEQVREVAGDDGRKRKQVIPAGILSVRTLYPPEQAALLSVGTLEEGILASLNQTGTVDVAYIADLLGRDDTEALANEIAESGQAFRVIGDPDSFLHRTAYLSGDVLTELEKARKAAILDPRFGMNVAALEAVSPQPVPFERVRAPFGATWVPGYLYQEFINEVAGVNLKSSPVYDPRSHIWFWPGLSGHYSQTASSRFGTSRVSWDKVVQNALSQDPGKVMDRIEGGGQVFNPKETAILRARVESLNSEWTAWVGRREDTKKILTDEFNARFNRVVPPRHEGEHLTFPGIATGPGALVPRFYQRNAVARFLAKPAGVVAHGTGYGKTLTAILIAHEHRRIGSAKKPLMVCDSANYAQFVAGYRQVYPQDNILVADDANFSPKERENFKALVAYGDWHCILMSRTQFERIPVSTETQERWMAEELSDLRYSLDVVSGLNDKKNQRKIEKKIEKKAEALNAFMNEQAKRSDIGLTWEQLGVDLLIVDECHRHKKTGFATAFTDIKGIDSNTSNRGRDLLMKGDIIQSRRKGMGVIGLSGTPATNTMAEFWNMNRLFDPNALQDFGVPYFDDFKTSFCETETRLEMNEANGRYRYIERMSKFVNARVLAQFVRTGCDIQLDPEKLNLTLPEHESGGVEHAVVPITDSVLEEMEKLSEIYDQYEKLSGEEKREMSFVPLTLMGMGMAASIDPRLVNPSAPDEPGSLLNTIVRNVVNIRRETAPTGRKTQVIFLDRYRTMNTSVLDQLRAKGMKSVSIEIDDTPEPVASDDPDSQDAGEAVTDEKADFRIGTAGINLYIEIRSKLVASGEFRPEEIAIIGEAKDARERAEIFERVCRGEILVVLGSSDKLGIGANFQDLLYAAHNFDPPRNMTPDQQEQRDGRIVRSGNTNEKVRVFLYGMQDTCTVAIWNRIQTKRRFIRQGLSESGGEDEIDDVGEIQLEEFKAALVADKRQLKVAELKGNIKDERLAIEVVRSRKGSLKSQIRSLEQWVDSIQTVEIVHALKEKNWIAQNTTPFESKLTVDISDLRTVERGSTIEWFAERAKAKKPTIITGSSTEVEKELSGLVDALRQTKLDGQVEHPLGSLTVNGFRVRLTYALVTFKSSGREAESLLMSVANPVRGEGNLLVSLTQFASAGMLLRTVTNIPRLVEERLASAHMKLKSLEADLEVTKAEFAKVTIPSDERLKSLEAELEALEKDMVEHPYVRGSRRENRDMPVKSYQPDLTGGPKAVEPQVAEAVRVGARAMNR